LLLGGTAYYASIIISSFDSQYLLDADGLGRSPHDLAAVMLDMGGGASFASAFKAHIGLSQSEYQAQFWARMDAYLPQSEFPRKTVGLALSLLLAASLMGFSLIWGFRHWPAVATTPGAVSEPASGHRHRRWFVAEISVFAVLTIGFAALLLHQIAFADDLPPAAPRASWLPGHRGLPGRRRRDPPVVRSLLGLPAAGCLSHTPACDRGRSAHGPDHRGYLLAVRQAVT
jgi:hypothetical protein